MVAVIVVLLAGLVALLGAKEATKHNQVLAVAKDIPIGSTVTADDLVAVGLTSDPSLAPVPLTDEQQIVGQITQVPLTAGELLARSMVGASSGFVAGQTIVPVALKPSQIPARALRPGDRVTLVGTPGTNGTVAAAQTPTGSTAPSGSGTGASATPTGLSAGSAVAATVTEVGSFEQSAQVEVVDVRVASADATTLAELASTGNIAVLVQPAGNS